MMPSVLLRYVIHAGDSPLAPMKKEIDPPTPIFSFCKTPDYSDIMIPNTIEGDVFIRPAAKRAFRPKSRAGKSLLHYTSCSLCLMFTTPIMLIFPAGLMTQTIPDHMPPGSTVIDTACTIMRDCPCTSLSCACSVQGPKAVLLRLSVWKGPPCSACMRVAAEPLSVLQVQKTSGCPKQSGGAARAALGAWRRAERRS